MLCVLAWGTGCSQTTERPAAGQPSPGTPAVVTPPNPTEPERYPLLTPVTPVQGRVTFVNAKLRFVILDCTFHRLPQPGQRLGLYRDGERIGEVRISGPTRGSTTVADVMSGSARLGDQVRED